MCNRNPFILIARESRAGRAILLVRVDAPSASPEQAGALVFRPGRLPEVKNRLERSRNRSPDSWIHHRFRLRDATGEDVAEYIAHHLALASANKSVSSADAVALTHATDALETSIAYAHGTMPDAPRRERQKVDREAVDSALLRRMPIA